jgi:hypothetical protein
MRTHLNVVQNLDRDRGCLGWAVVGLFFVLAAVPVDAQEITGTPGSPSATTTIDGRQVPPPDPKFGVSWPGHTKDLGGIRNQFHHIIDIVGGRDPGRGSG